MSCKGTVRIIDQVCLMTRWGVLWREMNVGLLLPPLFQEKHWLHTLTTFPLFIGTAYRKPQTQALHKA